MGIDFLCCARRALRDSDHVSLPQPERTLKPRAASSQLIHGREDKGSGPATRPMGALSALWKACHPEPTAAVTVLAGVLAFAGGGSAVEITLVTIAVLLSQLSTGWGNDYLDAERDLQTGRTDKPIPSGKISGRAVGLASAISAATCILTAFFSGLAAGFVLTAALACAHWYNFRLKSSIFSVLPYLIAFACLPAFVILSIGRIPSSWLIAGGSLLGAAAHFANVLPDLSADARTGIRGLPHRLGLRGTRIAAAISLIGASVALAAGAAGLPLWVRVGSIAFGAAVLGIGFLLGRRPGSRASFRAVLIIAVVDAVLLVTSGFEE